MMDKPDLKTSNILLKDDHDYLENQNINE